MSGAADRVAPIRRAAGDVSVALRQELGELGRLDPGGARAWQCNIMALSVALATIVALAVRVDSTWWAAISAFVSTQATAPASLRRGMLRIVGTAAGAVLGLVLSRWLVEDTVALSLVLLVVGTTGVLGLLVSEHGYAWLLGAVTVAMVLLAALADPLSAPDVACSRTAEVTIGTLAALLMVVLLAPAGADAVAAPAPGWSDLLGREWPAVQHALRAGIGVMLVPQVWSWLELPSLSQTAVTVAAVMAVPGLTNDPVKDEARIVGRGLHRLLGCLLGGLVGLGCLALSVTSFVPWLVMLMGGIWVAAYVQTSARGVGYVGTQGAVVFISTLVQGGGPPSSIMPGIDRFVGITSGVVY